MDPDMQEPELASIRKHDEIQKLLYAMYDEYKTALGISTGTSSSTQARSKKFSRYTWDMLEEEDGGTGAAGMNEVTVYLDSRIMLSPDEYFENLDVLKWWQINAHHYHVLSMMARDLLTTPVSTVASESAFSLSGRILSPKRNRLSPKHLEALVCTKDWILAEERAQAENEDDEYQGEYNIDHEFVGEGF